MLQIFGRVLHRLGLIPALEGRAAAEGIYYCPRTDVYWRYLVGVLVSLGYLGQDKRQLSMLMLPNGVSGRTFFVDT